MSSSFFRKQENILFVAFPFICRWGKNVTCYHCTVYNSLTLLNMDSGITYRANLEFVTSVTHKILDMGSTIYKNAITLLQT